MMDDAQKILGLNFIGGQRTGSQSQPLTSRDAATGAELPWHFSEATEQEIDDAAMAASAAYPLYRQTTPEERACFLETIADELDALNDEFIGYVCQETALPEGRIRGERTRTSNQMRLFAKVLRRGDFLGARIDTAQPDRKPMPKVDLRQYRVALGPVAVFGASNFPLAFSVAGGDTASALAAGCPVVVKAHWGHMVTSEYVAMAITRAVERCAMPVGVFNMIYGDMVGQSLVKHPAIKAVGFTGSLRGGRAIFDLAAAREEPIPVFAEMSSINPVIVLPKALQNRGAKIGHELIDSANMGAGQFCTKPGIVLGMKSAEFSACIKVMAEAVEGKPAQVMLNQGVFANYQQGVNRLEEKSGVSLLALGQSVDGQAQPRLYQADSELLLAEDELLQEEVFGPLCIVIEVADEDALLRALAKMRGQLTGTILADETDLADFEAVTSLFEEKVGRILLNGYPTGVEVCDSMVHGGPYPATSDARGTSVGTLAIDRYLRPVCYQNYPDEMLPAALKNANPLQLLRLVDGELTRAPI